MPHPAEPAEVSGTRRWSVGFTLLLAMVAAVPALCAGTESEEGLPLEPDFDQTEFYARADVANWLLLYDRVAWHTSDLVMEEPRAVLDRLGTEWFCFVHKKVWHAVYGHLDQDTDHYEVTLHYAREDGEFRPSRKRLPQSTLDAHARALTTAGRRLDPVLKDAGIRFNQYVRASGDQELEVWVFPAWQTDGRLFYGSEYHVVLDAKGKTILRESIPELQLKETRPEKESTWLMSNEDADLPSIGQLFTLMLVRDRVKLAGIRNRDYTTLYIRVPSVGKDVWANVANNHDLDLAIRVVQRIETQKEE